MASRVVREAASRASEVVVETAVPFEKSGKICPQAGEDVPVKKGVGVGV
jgi:hypothetical protein